jgi:hypothetical protein
MASWSPWTALSLLLLSVAFAPQAAATPTVVLSDPAGDASPFVPVLDADVLDLLTVTADSDGTDLAVTFAIGDLYEGQSQSQYDVQFVLTTAMGDVEAFFLCLVGDHGTGLAENDCQFGFATPTFSDPPASVVSNVKFPVPFTVDYDANTVTATVSYAAMGGASGDVAGHWYAESCEMYFETGICSDDISPNSWTPHTLG